MWNVDRFLRLSHGQMTLHCAWANPCAAHRNAGDDTCLLTYDALRARHSLVEADDGRIYDALALQLWFRVQAASGSCFFVIPGKAIGKLRPVRVHRLSPPLRSAALWATWHAARCARRAAACAAALSCFLARRLGVAPRFAVRRAPGSHPPPATRAGARVDAPPRPRSRTRLVASEHSAFSPYVRGARVVHGAW